jgi:urease accessory protein
MASSLLLLLLDSRAPVGAGSHSGGMEAAVETGWVQDLAEVEAFCRGRLRTSGAVAAAFAATACRLATNPAARGWGELDQEFEARTSSEATRAASRQLGGGLRRLLRATVAGPVFDAIDDAWRDLAPPAPHHPLVLGAACALAGGDATMAARAAALGVCTAPATAAIRLLGLDPYGVHAVLARLAPDIDCLAAGAAASTELPAGTAPALDLLADVHVQSEVRLFAS